MEPHHVALTVLDLDASQSWYARAFGFEPQLEFTLPDGVRGAMLRSATGARIELFEVAGAGEGLTHADPPTAMRTRGYGHVGFATDDLQGAFDAAVNAGAAPVWDPRPSPEPGLSMAFVHDLEGNLVELIGPER
ncbi:MAG TPA: VOC family protein [Solirubrobacteraceae bacterium]|nr:VOC family protein [Solirubrobacteraceae bacterium]